MNKLFMLAGSMALASATGALPQTPATPHQQHQAAAEHEQAVAVDSHCCCEEMMRKMMIEMMQKHQQMGVAQPTEPKPQPEEHKH